MTDSLEEAKVKEQAFTDGMCSMQDVFTCLDELIAEVEKLRFYEVEFNTGEAYRKLVDLNRFTAKERDKLSSLVQICVNCKEPIHYRKYHSCSNGTMYNPRMMEVNDD